MADTRSDSAPSDTVPAAGASGTSAATAETPAFVTVRLARGRDKAVRGGHPWIYSGAIEAVEGPGGERSEAPLARVVGAGGEPLGIGLWSPRSQIRVRLLEGVDPEARTVDRAFFAARLAEALALRAVVVPPETTGYRVLNAEGDGVPGWTVDRFGEVLVSQITAAGLEALRGEAYAALGEAFPGLAVVQANTLPARRAEGLSQGIETIAGTRSVGEVPEEAPFTEHGLDFVADVAGGQKTGFYLDQRDNRRLAARLAVGHEVLDLFAHAGAFGAHALAGGARRVVHVESSARLIESGRRQHAANGLPADAAEWVRVDAFADLRERTESYGLVICDPPPLARRRADRDRAARAYKDLNRLALGRVAPGGFLLTFTCSAAIDSKLFRQILWAAAGEAGRRVALLAPLAAAPDHPVAITHPEGEYLKGWLAVVRGS